MDLHKCPICQRSMEHCTCGGGNEDVECASAKSALLREMARRGADHIGGYSRRELDKQPCYHLKTLARLYSNWKDASERRNDAFWTKQRAESDAYWANQKRQSEQKRAAEIQQEKADGDMADRINSDLRDRKDEIEQTLLAFKSQGASPARYAAFAEQVEERAKAARDAARETGNSSVYFAYSSAARDLDNFAHDIRFAAPRGGGYDPSSRKAPGEIGLPSDDVKEVPAGLDVVRTEPSRYRPTPKPEPSTAPQRMMTATTRDDINDVAEQTANTAAIAIGSAGETIKDKIVDQGLQPTMDIAHEHTTDKFIDWVKEKLSLPESSDQEPPGYGVGEEYKNEADKASDRTKDLNTMVQRFQGIIDRIGKQSRPLIDNPNAKVGDHASSGYQSGPAPGRGGGSPVGGYPSQSGVQPIQLPSSPSLATPDPFQKMLNGMKAPSPSPTPDASSPEMLLKKMLRGLNQPAPTPTPTPKPAEPVDLFGNPSGKK